MPTSPFPLRNPCPPGACVCEREQLLEQPDADIRILRLTREEEKRLVARIHDIASYAELQRIQQRMQEQLGIEVRIAPGSNEVRTVRGLDISVTERPGLCKKLRQSIPAAIRKCMDKHPAIVYELLNTHDLFGTVEPGISDNMAE
jgi:Trp operon repressor